jgi:GNAT superfamily N-acetyltransferase
MITSDQTGRLHTLYNDCFDLLKMSIDNFTKRLFWNDREKTFFLAEVDNKIIGYLITTGNSILLLAVDEKYRNNGIGSDLLRHAEREIKAGYSKINVAAPDYFLCGVPFDTKSNYHGWFENRGFVYDWTPFDMTVDLDSRTYKDDDVACSIDGVLLKKLEKNSGELMSCRSAADSVEEGWGEYFLKDDVEAYIAVKDEEVIGGVMAPSFCMFDESLKDAGSFGLLWVRKEYRKKGLGMKLYHKALWELKNRGYKVCHIGYTYLDVWYGTLGAVKYMNYWIGDKKL